MVTRKRKMQCNSKPCVTGSAEVSLDLDDDEAIDDAVAAFIEETGLTPGDIIKARR